MNVHVFTTGRGTPYGLAEAPVIKVATTSGLARALARPDGRQRRHASPTATATIEETGWALFQLLLEVASGERTCAERLGLHNALVLFNPAPVT